MSYEASVNWKSLLQNARWVTFTHNGSEYRAAEYSLDGGTFVAIHKFVGVDKCPSTQGWAGQQWCAFNNQVDNWPSKEMAQKIVEEAVDLPAKPQAQPESIVETPRITPNQNSAINGIPIPPPAEKRY